MRLLIFILLFSLGADAQIIKANSFYRITAAPAGCTNKILDDYSGAYVALSLRLLDCNYAGSAIRVRRSSDNAEQDIGFVSNYLDTAGMKTFVGANNGFVVTWYDQSGNGYNATQSTAGYQPAIISSGNIYYDTGLPSILFDGFDDYISASTGTISTTEISIFTVFNKTATGYFRNVYSRASTISASGSFDYISTGWVAVHVNGSNVSSYKDAVNALSGWTANTTYLGYARLSGSNVYLTANGASEASASGATNSINSNLLSLGKDVLSGDSYLNGYVTETILYISNQSSNSAAIRSNINSFYTIY